MSKINDEERVYQKKIMYISFSIAILFVIILSLVASKIFICDWDRYSQGKYLQKYENGQL
jgi:hypothetical protein